IGILLYLDLEFWEGTLKTLTPSLQENAKYFTTRSYLTLTIQQVSMSKKWDSKPALDEHGETAAERKRENRAPKILFRSAR
ncbi:hypothetical protein, partial [Hominenteromicrobium sp.]|uniref:hypothetical protein n=1 Tax=Hominenteromicrobium sp. TaxID=3073581 RepID=UPI003AB2F4A5